MRGRAQRVARAACQWRPVATNWNKTEYWSSHKTQLLSTECRQLLATPVAFGKL